MEYSRIIKQGLQMTWRHKALWLFGVAAVIFGGGYRGGGFQYNLSNADVQRWRQMMPGMPYMIPRGLPGGMISNFSNLLPLITAAIGLLAIVALVMSIAGIIVRYTSMGALISMVDEVRQTQETSFRTGLNRGWRRFLRLFAIDLLIGLGAFVLVLATLLVLGVITLLIMLPGIAMLSSGRGVEAIGIIWLVISGLGFVFLLVLCCIAIGAIVTVVRAWAERACVLDQQGVFASLGHGLSLLRERTRESLTWWLLMGLINMAVGLVVFLAMLCLIGLAAALGLAASGVAHAPLWLILIVPLILLLAAAGTLAAGIYAAFQSSVWTLAYRELEPSKA